MEFKGSTPNQQNAISNTTDRGPVITPAVVSIVVDEQSWNDDVDGDDECFEGDAGQTEDDQNKKREVDDKGRQQQNSGSHPPPRYRIRSVCSNFGSELRFIDDSAPSSLTGDSRRASRQSSIGFPGSEEPPEPHLLLLPSNDRGPRLRLTSDSLALDIYEHPDQHCYSSLTTLTLSDRHSSLFSRDNSPSYTSERANSRSNSSRAQRPPSYSADTINGPAPLFGPANRPGYYQTSFIPAIPLKSCLVEVDPRGRRVSCSCLAFEPRQLSFHHDSYHISQFNQGIPEVREVPLSNGQILYYKTKRPETGTNNTHEDVDGQSQYSLYMDSDCRYYFQHPYARFFVAYFVIFCNFLIFAEDPVSHSHTESEIPVVGNVFSFVMTKYPPEWEWKLIKVLLWIAAIVTGMAIGKHIIHKLLLARLCRLKMFHEEQGSWMIMFLTVIVLLYIISNVYNAILLIGHPMACTHQITAQMGITNSSLMKAAACGTWLGDFITAWMVTDMMLQDNLYPNLGPKIRAFWRKGNTRIVTFWGGSIGMSALVVALIVSDWINWDKLNRDFVATTELSRAFLASFILVMDLLIVMQDWDFPHFTSTLDINLPGMKVKAVKLNFCDCPMNIQRFWKIHITGKWFNYGIIILVMILDLNMWKNQMFYKPENYGQYLSPDSKIYTVSEYDILITGNRTLWTYQFRSTHIDPATNLSLLENDMLMNSRFLAYALEEKCTTFIPIVIGFFMFGLLVYLYGRFPPKETEDYGGRLKRRKKMHRSSWRRERGSAHAHNPPAASQPVTDCSTAGQPSTEPDQQLVSSTESPPTNAVVAVPRIFRSAKPPHGVESMSTNPRPTVDSNGWTICDVTNL